MRAGEHRVDAKAWARRRPPPPSCPTGARGGVDKRQGRLFQGPPAEAGPVERLPALPIFWTIVPGSEAGSTS